MNNLHIIEHPLISHCLSIIRDKNTNYNDFKRFTQQITRILVYEATKNLLLETIEVETPNCKTLAETFKKNVEIFVVPILRSGLAMSDSFAELVPNIRIQHLGMFRNEETLQPVWYYNKLPKTFKNPNECLVYICDPMLATGNSAYEAINLYVNEKKIPQKNITFVNLIACPTGIEKLFKNFPDIKIITAAVDEKLNEKGYIMPGLGDAGDRVFNTIY